MIGKADLAGSLASISVSDDMDIGSLEVETLILYQCRCAVFLDLLICVSLCPPIFSYWITCRNECSQGDTLVSLENTSLIPMLLSLPIVSGLSSCRVVCFSI